jgi:hypothetical protein
MSQLSIWDGDPSRERLQRFAYTPVQQLENHETRCHVSWISG